MENGESNGAIFEAAGVDVTSTWLRRIEVSGVQWKIQAGEYWVLGGPHGSGKTDLLTTVAGLRRPAAGVIRIFGYELDRMSEAEMLQQRKRIGFVFKGGGRMLADLTVAENVALALCYHRNCTMDEAHDDVQAVLEMTGLAAFAERTAQALGADWQQRVGLARALALQPEVLFLDEPAAGLELRHRKWWRAFLLRMTSERPDKTKRKMTVIASTNDFALWQGGKHRFAVIKEKRLQLYPEGAEIPPME